MGRGHTHTHTHAYTPTYRTRNSEVCLAAAGACLGRGYALRGLDAWVSITVVFAMRPVPALRVGCVLLSEAWARPQLTRLGWHRPSAHSREHSRQWSDIRPILCLSASTRSVQRVALCTVLPSAPDCRCCHGHKHTPAPRL